jgi:hypothetical protein
MNGLTGIRDTDILILLQLEDRELGPVCSVNSYVRSLCNDENFWRTRIINRIKKGFENNLKFYPELVKIEINGNVVGEMKKYLGFSTLKELNSYLDKIPIPALYYLYLRFSHIDNIIAQIYEFDKKLLPKYINLEQIMFFLRRQFNINFYENKRGNTITIPKLYLKEDTPGYKRKVLLDYIQIHPAGYKEFQKLHIRT